MSNFQFIIGLALLLSLGLIRNVNGDCTNNGGTTCTGTDCCYNGTNGLSPVLGSGGGIDPIQECYTSGSGVTYTCPGDLRGPPFNTCNGGTWQFPFAPTCEGVTTCPQPTVPTDGSIDPDIPTYDLYTRITYACDDGYTLGGPSEAVCEAGGVWNPSTVPTCEVITTAGSSPQTSPQSSTTDITKITTPSASTPDKTDASTHVSSTQEKSTSKPAARSDKPNNVLIIALSTSLVLAFLLITFLVCVVVYRSRKQARVVSHTNGLILVDNTPYKHQEGSGSNINHQQSAESTASSVYPSPPSHDRSHVSHVYEEIDEDEGNGVHRDQPEYFNVIPDSQDEPVYLVPIS